MLSKNHWSHSGYDAEELYFAKLNRELIDRIKAKQSEEKTPLPEGHTAEVIPFPTQKGEKGEKKAA